MITSSSDTACARRASSARLDAAAGQPAERLGERLARDLLLALVAAAAAHAMPRLGDVRELEVQPERAQDRRRALLAERADVGREGRVIGRRAGLARLARELAHALDVGQQILAVLLDEHAPERVADQAHVAPQGPSRRLARDAAESSARVVGIPQA